MRMPDLPMPLVFDLLHETSFRRCAEQHQLESWPSNCLETRQHCREWLSEMKTLRHTPIADPSRSCWRRDDDCIIWFEIQTHFPANNCFQAARKSRKNALTAFTTIFEIFLAAQFSKWGLIFFNKLKGNTFQLFLLDTSVWWTVRNLTSESVALMTVQIPWTLLKMPSCSRCEKTLQCWTVRSLSRSCKRCPWRTWTQRKCENLMIMLLLSKYETEKFWRVATRKEGKTQLEETCLFVLSKLWNSVKVRRYN